MYQTIQEHLRYVLTIRNFLYTIRYVSYDTLTIQNFCTQYDTYHTIRIAYRMILTTMLTTKKLYIKGDILKTQNMSFTQLPKEQINGD